MVIPTCKDLERFLLHINGEEKLVPLKGRRSLTEAVELNKEAPRIISTFGKKEFKAVVGFVDMRGFSSKARGKTPLEVHALVKPFIDLVIKVSTGLQWFIDKTIGDEVMVIRPIFGQDVQYSLIELKTPTYTVMEITSFVSELILALRESNLDCNFSGGFAIGKVVLDRVGVDPFKEWTCYGNTINAAKRLQSEVSCSKEPGNIIAVGSLKYEVPDIKEQLDVWLQMLPAVERIRLSDCTPEEKQLKGVGEAIFVQGQVVLKGDNI